MVKDSDGENEHGERLVLKPGQLLILELMLRVFEPAVMHRREMADRGV
jgi:hypothetical protein